MLWTVALIFLVLWILGFAFDATMGGLVHVLLILFVIAIGIEIFRMLTRSRRT
ncbi:MAG: lmo0937 family membrane protein [Planctomycetes bacterium]|nr:lmo0937 family membrane protein [Planctomycetota bacterium]